MERSRRLVLTALLAVVAALTTVIISGLLGTVFFAITVAYVVVPYADWLRRRGLPPWGAAAVATISVFLGAAAVLSPVLIVLYIRRAQLLALIGAFPEEFTVELFGFTYAVVVSDLAALARGYVRQAALVVARGTPVIAAKATVFAFIVFAILARRGRLRRALLVPIPVEYHDIAVALHERIRETLYALYVIQAATAIGTFLVAVPVFALLGYRFPITLAVLAGVLQFLPVVGPSVVVFGLVAFELSVGDPTGAALAALLGLVFVAFLPDAAIRPRLARETARLPASLYFVGFTGGVLALGPVGIIAGPLAVALLVESLSLLADEVTPRDPSEGPL